LTESPAVLGFKGSTSIGPARFTISLLTRKPRRLPLPEACRAQYRLGALKSDQSKRLLRCPDSV